jgi:hypothetical protein
MSPAVEAVTHADTTPNPRIASCDSDSTRRAAQPTNSTVTTPAPAVASRAAHSDTPNAPNAAIINQ